MNNTINKKLCTNGNVQLSHMKSKRGSYKIIIWGSNIIIILKNKDKYTNIIEQKDVSGNQLYDNWGVREMILSTGILM